MKMLKLRHYNEDISNIIRKKYKKSAVSFVEIITALFILTLAILPAVGTFSSYYSLSTRQMEQEMALKIAESVINLMNTVSYDMIIDKTLNSVPLNIQTPNGTVQGTLIFKEVDPRTIGLSADGNTPRHPDNIHLQGVCEEIQINRIKYQVVVNVIREFRPQNLNTQHNEAMDFYYYDYAASDSVRYSSFDFAFVFNVMVSFGNAKPIKLSSFRADMVK